MGKETLNEQKAILDNTIEELRYIMAAEKQQKNENRERSGGKKGKQKKQPPAQKNKTGLNEDVMEQEMKRGKKEITFTQEAPATEQEFQVVRPDAKKDPKEDKVSKDVESRAPEDTPLNAEEPTRTDDDNETSVNPQLHEQESGDHGINTRGEKNFGTKITQAEADLIRQNGGMRGTIIVKNTVVDTNGNTVQPEAAPEKKMPEAVEEKPSIVRLDTGEIIELTIPNFYIGSENSASYVCRERYVSRKHAVILAKNGMHFLMDSGSTNGTFINGIKLTPYKEEMLRSGDIIKLATTEFQYKV